MTLQAEDLMDETMEEFDFSGIIDYHIAIDENLPDITASKYQYVMAASGLLIRARRKGLEVCLPIAAPAWPVMGLFDIQPYLNLDYPVVPAALLLRMLEMSRAVCKSQSNEDLLENLFYLIWDERNECWELIEPEQDRQHASVRPLEDDADSPYGRTFIEIHSHHTWEAQASEIDDTEEIGKFRIFVVLGDIFKKPSVRVRVCVHEYFVEVPADSIFEMPEGVTDALLEEIYFNDKETTG